MNSRAIHYPGSRKINDNRRVWSYVAGVSALSVALSIAKFFEYSAGYQQNYAQYG